MKVVIIIPTYNEKDNIGRLIEALNDEFNKSQENDYSILIVEGNSPDGTSSVVKEKMQKYSFVHMINEEEKAGLGAAYVLGFKKAINVMNADVLVEMDADFQHDPKDINRLVKPISEGYDYVIGSRFTKGGSIPNDWSLYRKFLSIGGNLFSKIVLGIYNVNDFTSGFKASRVKGFVDKLDLDNIMTPGFAYKIELLYKMYKSGAKIKEIPIIFGSRDAGTSKMEKNNPIDSLRVVVMLRIKEKRHFFKFVIVGFTGLFVDTSLFNLFRVLIFPSNISALFSGFIAMIVTFSLNNYWSFSDRKLQGAQKKALSFIIYILSSSVPILVRSKLVLLAVSAFNDTWFVSNTAFFIGIVFGLIWNYLIYSRFIWKDNRDA